MEGDVPFSGELQATTEEKVGLLKDLADRTPAFTSAVEAMHKAGIRDREGKSIERDSNGQVNVIERSFRVISEHGVTVGLAADSLGELLELSQHDREVIVSAALFHDVTKKVEVVLNGYRALAQEKRITDEATEVLIETLSPVQAISDEKPLAYHLEKISQGSVKAYLDYFRDEVDEPFLQETLAKTSLPQDMQQEIIAVAMTDTLTSIQRLKKTLPHEVFSNDAEDRLQPFRDIADHIQQDDTTSISFSENVNMLGPLHLYCDDISRGNRLVSLDERMDALKAGGQYTEMDEWAKSISGGLAYFDVERIVGHATEEVILSLAREKGTITGEVFPTDIPQIIMQTLQSRLSH